MSKHHKHHHATQNLKSTESTTETPPTKAETPPNESQLDQAQANGEVVQDVTSTGEQPQMPPDVTSSPDPDVVETKAAEPEGTPADNDDHPMDADAADPAVVEAPAGAVPADAPSAPVDSSVPADSTPASAPATTPTKVPASQQFKITCPKCGVSKTMGEFGARAMADGTWKTQTYCRQCRTGQATPAPQAGTAQADGTGSAAPAGDAGSAGSPTGSVDTGSQSDPAQSAPQSAPQQSGTPTMGRMIVYRNADRGDAPAVVVAVRPSGGLGLFAFHDGGYTEWINEAQQAADEQTVGWRWPTIVGASGEAAPAPTPVVAQPLNSVPDGTVMPATNLDPNVDQAATLPPPAVPIIPQATNPTEILPNQMTPYANAPLNMGTTPPPAASVNPGTVSGPPVAVAEATQAEVAQSVEAKGDANVSAPVKDPSTYVEGKSQGVYSQNATVESQKEAESTAQHTPVNASSMPINESEKAVGTDTDQVKGSTFQPGAATAGAANAGDGAAATAGASATSATGVNQAAGAANAPADANAAANTVPANSTVSTVSTVGGSVAVRPNDTRDPNASGGDANGFSPSAPSPVSNAASNAPAVSAGGQSQASSQKAEKAAAKKK